MSGTKGGKSFGSECWRVYLRPGKVKEHTKAEEGTDQSPPRSADDATTDHAET